MTERKCGRCGSALPASEPGNLCSTCLPGVRPGADAPVKPETGPAILKKVNLLVALALAGLVLLLLAVAILLRIGSGLAAGPPEAQHQQGKGTGTTEGRAGQPVRAKLSEVDGLLMGPWSTIMKECASSPSLILQQRGGLGVLVNDSDWRTLEAPDGFFLGYPNVSRSRAAAYAKCRDEATSENVVLRLAFDGQVSVLCGLPAGVTAYDVAPDERSVAYDLREGLAKWRIVLRRLDDGSERNLSEATRGGLCPAFSPDGKTLTYCGNRKLWVLDLASSQTTSIVPDSMPKELPRWSPDGAWIAYQANAGDQYSYDIWRVRVADQHAERLTHEPGLDVNPCYSADGTRLVFASVRNSTNVEWTNADLRAFTMNADGTGPKMVPDSPVNVFFPRW